MEFPLAWTLLLYMILVVVFLVVAGINAFHIVRFGSFDRRNRIMVACYIVVVVAVLSATVAYFASVDWSQALQISIPSASSPSFPSP